MDTQTVTQPKPAVLSDKQVFTKIWVEPREVFRFVNDHKYDKYVYLLLFFAGISRAFDRAVMKDLGDHMSLLGILGTCIIFGGLLGWLSFYIYAALVSWTGKWVGGQGTTTAILRVFSYAMTPAIVALILLIPQIAVYGIELFRADGDITSADWFSNLLVYSSAILELLLGIWTMVLVVVAIAEVQKVSIGKAILNAILPVLVLIVPLLTFFFLLSVV